MANFSLCGERNPAHYFFPSGWGRLGKYHVKPGGGSRGGGTRFSRLAAGAVLYTGIWLLILLSLAGCSDIGYYWQAGLGQWEIIRKRRPIEEVLSDPAVDAQTKEKLTLLRTAQIFGVETLSLPQGASFKYYTDLGRPYVSWLVVASEAYRIEEVKQCYFIVGCLGYRGFFHKEDAEAFALDLSGQEYDTLVRPVAAYSTLGWFDDPVLNTYLRSPDAQLVSTVFHEQAHQVLFIKGDTAFNESFATLVAQVGLHRFLEHQGKARPGELARRQVAREESRRFREIVLRGKARLQTLYAALPPPAQRAEAKARLFEEMRQDYQKAQKSFKILQYDGWFNQPLNNAHLVGFSQYRSRVEAFEKLLQQHGGDLARFFQAARELSRLPPTEREARLKALEGGSIAKS